MAATNDTGAIINNTAELKNLTKTLQQTYKSHSKIADENAKAFEHSTDSVEDFTSSVNENSKAFKKYKQKEEELHKLKTDAAKLEEELNELKKEEQQLNLAHMSMTKEQIEQEKKDRDEKIKAKREELDATREQIEATEENFKNLGDVIKSAGKPFLAFVGFLKYLGGGFLELNKQLMEVTTASHGVIEATSSSFESSMLDLKRETFELGMSMHQLGEITSKNRQMVNALGGRDAMENIIKNNENMRAFYGTLADSAAANAQIMSEFGKKGIIPTQQTLTQYNEDLTRLATTTNLSASELNHMIDSIANDTDSLSQLKAVREGERESILANQRALLKSNVALGMTAEQAAEAGKMLNKMSSHNPLERFKQAAKIQAMGAAVGLGAEAAAAAAELRKPKGQQNQEVLRDFNVQMTGLVDTAAQQGIGQEIFMTEMMGKLDMNQYYGEGSAFSATLGNVYADGVAKMGDRYQSSAESWIVPINNVADKISNVWEAVKDGTLVATYIGEGIFKILDMVKNLNFPDLSAITHPIDHIEKVWSDKFTEIGQNWDSFTSIFKPGDMNLSSDTIAKEAATTAIKLKKPNEEQKINMDNSIFEDMRKKLEAPPKPMDSQPEIPARSLPSNQVVNVKTVADPAKESVEQARTDKTESLMTNHINIATKQVDKIEEQLVKMNNANEYLKTIAETNPKLLDIAEKQLVAMTLNEQQKAQMATKLRTESAKFASDYSYIV